MIIIGKYIRLYEILKNIWNIIKVENYYDFGVKLCFYNPYSTIPEWCI